MTAARALGLKRFSGEACPKGHNERYASSGACVACKISSTTACYAVNKDTRTEYQREWNRSNPDEPAAAARYNSTWRQRNPGKVREFANTRRARKLSVGGRHTSAQIDSLFHRQGAKCAHPWCKADLTPGYHIDHIMPLALGGSNGIRNIQLLCPPCNRKKSAKHPVDFAQQNGFLL